MTTNRRTLTHNRRTLTLVGAYSPTGVVANILPSHSFPLFLSLSFFPSLSLSFFPSPSLSFFPSLSLFPSAPQSFQTNLSRVGLAADGRTDRQTDPPTHRHRGAPTHCTADLI
eukprot:GHVU01175540.1.p1 GENE.GHVU01175540.1~~GHVU01175540.1.p1  ORF type:complete len:113 (+),score=6.71 GHVU01175540.1:122-460(+)